MLIRDYRYSENDKCFLSNIKKDYRKKSVLLDEAWDLFSEYIGENQLKTPLSVNEFELIFNNINNNRDNKFSNLKYDILKSFRYDSYSWPIVKRM